MSSSSPLKLYGISNCQSVRKAREWLSENEIPFIFQDLKKNPPSVEQLKAWLERTPKHDLLNRKSSTWRNLDPNTQALAQDKNNWPQLLANFPTLIKRPVLEAPDFLLLGFEEAQYKQYFPHHASEKPKALPQSSCPTRALAEQLLQQKSITPDDAYCQDIIGARLQKLGFSLENMRFGDVDNLWAVLDRGAPYVCFAGHTDVVPPGPEALWQSPPFTPTERDGNLYARGAADMKSSLAAFVTATEAFLQNHPQPKGSIAFLITSDEEGVATHGTKAVVETLAARHFKMDYCIVGEPTSGKHFGDTIKNGRRGSLNGKLTVHGVQGHVAYPHLGRNPIHQAAPALAALCAEVWDEGNAYFPPTSFQISNFQSGTGATNVIPAQAEILFNFRFSTEQTPQSLQTRVETILKAHQLDYSIEWTLSGKPFLTPAGKLTEALQKSIATVCAQHAELSTSGGTSDGRFIQAIAREVVEFGPLNASIHKINEHIAVRDLARLSSIYEHVLGHLLT